MDNGAASNIPWIISGIGLGLAIVGPILGWWGSNRYFTGRFDQWKEDVKERFDRVNERITGIEALSSQMQDARTEIRELRAMKHEVGGLKQKIELLVAIFTKGKHGE